MNFYEEAPKLSLNGQPSDYKQVRYHSKEQPKRNIYEHVAKQSTSSDYTNISNHQNPSNSSSYQFNNQMNENLLNER